MQVVNDRVAPDPFYERGLELQDDAPMTVDYCDALQVHPSPRPLPGPSA